MSAPDSHAVAVLVLTGVALVLFTREWFSLELSSLILIVLLTMGFTLFPYERNGVALEPTDLFFGLGVLSIAPYVLVLQLPFTTEEGLYRTAEELAPGLPGSPPLPLDTLEKL